MSQVRTHRSHSNNGGGQENLAIVVDPEEAADRLRRDLRSAPEGLSTREAQRARDGSALTTANTAESRCSRLGDSPIQLN